MFTVDTNMTDLKAKEKSLLKVLFSMNTHQVATPEMSLEDARSYVIFCREGGAKVSAYIGLHLLETNRRLFYPHSSNPFPEGDMHAIDEEARNFVEGLGAMLDEIDITKMSPEEKNNWIDDQAIFNLKIQIETRSGEEPSAQASQEQFTAPAEEPDAAPASPDSQPLRVEQKLTITESEAPVVQSISPVQPAPVVQPQEVPVQTVQVQTAQVVQPVAPVQPVPAAQPTEVPAEAAPVDTAPAHPASEATPQTSEQPGPQKSSISAPVQADQHAPAKRQEDILQRAIKAGVVKAPKLPQLRKEIRSASGIVNRDKEALARLLSSF